QGGSLHAQGGFVRPSAVLFNGGVFKAKPLRERIVSILSQWSDAPVPALDAEDPDLAVARGATYYGLVRKGKGIRIRGGVSRAYAVGSESPARAVRGVPRPIKALCVAPLGMEEGPEPDAPGSEIGLVVGEPAVSRSLSSTTRREDAIGAVLERWAPEDLQEL